MFINTISVVGIKGFYVASQLAVGIVLARSLGSYEFGIYSLAMATITIFLVPASAGLPTLILRESAIAVSKGDGHKVFSLLFRGTIEQKILFIVWSVLLFIIYLFEMLPQWVEMTIIIASLSLTFASALLNLSTSSLMGSGRVVIGQLFGQVLRPLLMLSLLLVIGGLSSLSAAAAIACGAAAAFVALVVAWIVQARAFVAHDAFATGWKMPLLIKQGLPFMLLSGAQTTNHYIDLLMVGGLLEVASAGKYRIAVQVGDAVGSILIALGLVAAPRLAAIHNENGWDGLKKAIPLLHCYSMLSVLPPVLLFCMFPETVIDFLFGHEYHESAAPAVIIVVGKFLYAGVCLTGIAMSMAGIPLAATVTTLVGAGANILLNAILIPTYGIIGAALATTVSSLFVGVLGSCWVLHKFGVNISAIGILPWYRKEVRNG